MAAANIFVGSGNSDKVLKIPINRRKLLREFYNNLEDKEPMHCQQVIEFAEVGVDRLDGRELEYVTQIDQSFNNQINNDVGFREIRPENDNIQLDNIPRRSSALKLSDSITSLTRLGSYTTWDLIVNIASIIFYLIDIVTDSLLVISYYKEKRYVFFGLTLAFMTVPSIVMNMCSFFWYLDDYRSYKDKRSKRIGPNWVLLTCLHIFGSLFQLGPILRYASAIHYGLKSRKNEMSEKERKYFYLLSLEEDKDSCFLRLFESALEAGPQLILQLYIMITQPKKFKDPVQLVLQVLSILTSWFGMSWAHVAYHRALRFSRTDKKNMSIFGSILYLLWRIFEVGPRVIALAAFAEAFTTWVFVVTAIHWVMMTCWYGFQRIYEKPMFGPNWRYLDHAFNMVCAAVAIFGFLNVKEGHTRYRCGVYYLLFYVENVAMVILWFSTTKKSDQWYYWAIFVVGIMGFYLCIGFQLLYYKLCHPSHKIYWCLENSDFFQSLCFTPKPKTPKSPKTPKTHKRDTLDNLLQTPAQLTQYRRSGTDTVTQTNL